MKVRELRLDLRPLIKKLEIGLRRGYSEETLTSTFRSVFKGRGLEFDGFRQYTSEDDAKDIDWKASLRTHQLLIRVLTEERNINTFFMLDVSDSMIFSSTDKLKCEYAAELVATLAYGIIETGDSAGLCMFTDKIAKLIPGNVGMNQFYRITRSLSNPEHYGGNFDFNYAMRYTTNFLKRGSVVFIVSDFIGLKPEWERYFQIMASKYEIIGIMIRDPRDNLLPGDAGQYVVADPYSEHDILIDTKLIKGKYDVMAKQQVEQVKAVFTKIGADFIMLNTEDNFIYPILKLFRRRHLK
ncbi:MAG: DUF58 domain-containing protein [Candidatus Woesearchaeota archaeon]